MAAGDTRTEHFLDVLAHGSRADIPQENCCNTKTQNYILGAINRIIDVEEEVEWLENNPDVADIVATYAALQAYDTSSLTDKDIIRVLSDETHEGQSTYYRYDKSDDSWDFIGTIGDYYTKTQLDTILEGKQDVLTAGENISIVDESGSLVISATDTTYTAGTGIDIDNGVISATSSGPTVVQSTGTSTTDVMSQNATTSMVFADPSTKQRVQIGDDDTFAQDDGAVAIGCNLTSAELNAIAIGKRAQAQRQASLALGWKTIASANGSVALGTGARASTVGQFDIGEANGVYGYNNSNYRLLTGLYDPQSAHDAATKGYIDARVLTNAGAPTTATVGAVGQLLEDTTNGKLYICTDATNPYIWEEAGAGGASYTAGDGIDITNDVISATNTGKAKVLTTADYNWNDITSTTENPNSLALWLLPPGVYQTSGMKVQMTKSEGLGTGSSNLWVVAKADNTAVSFRIPIADPRYNQPSLYICNATTGQKGGGSNTGIMRTSDIVDGLTSTAADKVLSAKQGKALKDLIDALVIPTKTSDIVNDGSDGTSTYVEADELPAVLTNAQYNALWSQPNQLNLILENIVSGGGV